MKKFFTLVELIIVIVVIGILSVIVIPNISSMKTKATQTELLGNKTNIQTAVDTITLSDKEVPTVGGGKATLGNPQKVDLEKIAPEYIRSLPNKDANYWIDYQGVIYGSLSELPSNPKVTDSGFIFWEETKGSYKYKIYKGDGDTQSSARGQEFVMVKELQANSNPDGNYSYKGEKGMNYFITSEDSLGNETPLVGLEYNKLVDLNVETTKHEFKEEGTISISPSDNSTGVKPYKYSYLDKEYEGESLSFNVYESGVYKVVVYFSNGETKELSIEIEIDLEIKTENYSFEGEDREQIQTIDLENLFEVISINSDNGEVNVVSIEDNIVTVELTNGNISREELISGEYIPEETKNTKDSIKNNSSEFDKTIEYNKDGFKGILQKDGKPTSKIVSGEYKKEESKQVTNQPSKDYNKDGFKGTLSKYLHSGEYKPEEKETKTVTNKNTVNSFPSSIPYNSGGFNGTLTKKGNVTSKVISGSYTPKQTKEVTNQPSANYNKDGYKGTLSKYIHGYKTVEADTKTEYIDIVYHFDKEVDMGPLYWVSLDHPKEIEYVDKENSGKHKYHGTLYVKEFIGEVTNVDFVTVRYSGEVVRPEYQEEIYRYKGTVTKPEVDTRVYEYYQEYSGTVTKPASDTRVYKYQGTVVKPEVDTRVYEYTQKYSGTVTKPEKDTRVFRYKGTVVKPEVDTRVYEYTQKYSGIVTKPEVDTRVFRYKGTVTKPEVDTRVYEYTQKYSGTVTKPEVDTRVYKDIYEYNLEVKYK